ncbi:hypothetical protein GCM10025867_02860 [Frondihabitans sucicola]|uniref:Uncharacterized protein n=1 Tax=Frondihabitans sucicola TaxID=1268041 RepID=A0ABN6XWL5_9MICO|nr:hypothetical protein [Frondihabitans sucicola]BDZ48045.1 hypothetical protein GCM10025867_02860 [Frondihabitans sucicola]
MKRISYDGLTLVTGSDTADALVRYAATAFSRGDAVNVDLPVLEADGFVREHTVVIGPAGGLDVVDVDVRADETREFPVPVFPVLRRAGRALPPEEILDLEWSESA